MDSSSSAPRGTRVSYFNGVNTEYGTVTGDILSEGLVWVIFDGETVAKICYRNRVELVEKDIMDEPVDEITRHNEFKAFEKNSEGKILDDEEIWQRGFDAALSLMEDKLSRLKKYEEAGNIGDMLRNSRRSVILDEHIASQPTPVKQAWRKYLSTKKAL